MSATPRSDVRAGRLAATPSRQAFLLLRTVFTVAPILFGLDKFANVLTDWPRYLAPGIDDIVPGTAQQAMYAVGVVEILAGIAVALVPRYGALLTDQQVHHRQDHGRHRGSARRRRSTPSFRAPQAFAFAIWW
jgi:hypothetical protein